MDLPKFSPGSDCLCSLMCPLFAPLFLFHLLFSLSLSLSLCDRFFSLVRWRSSAPYFLRRPRWADDAHSSVYSSLYLSRMLKSRVCSRLLGLCPRSSFRLASARSLSRRGQNLQGMQLCSYSGSNIPRDKTNLPVFDESLPSRSLTDYIIPPAVLLFLGTGIWLIHKNDERRATKGSNNVKRFERNPQGIWPYGGPFRLVNTENELVTEADLLGNWILMFFGYTSSPDVCPEEVQKMAQVIDILDHQCNLKITPIFISIDPQRDSPAQLQAYLREFHPKIVGLTGPVAAVRQIAQEFRVFFKKVEEEGQDYLVESTNDMILLNPEMKIVGRFGLQYDAEQLSEAVLKEVKKASK